MRDNRKRIAVGSAAALVLAVVSLLAAMGASARDGHGRDDGARGHEAQEHDKGAAFLRSSLAPSLTTDPAIHGVAPGGAPWELKRGTVRIGMDGKIRARLDGLVIPVAHGAFPAGTARPVTVVSASLYCAPDSSAAVATTSAVPISEAGDATIAETIALPATCLAPIVLIHPNQSAAAYIAASGWRR